jgi:hypothetical protein
VPIPNDYLERVYAGVLGKIIGVILGAPLRGGPTSGLFVNWGQSGITSMSASANRSS